jgi:hypothetical protein
MNEFEKTNDSDAEIYHILKIKLYFQQNNKVNELTCYITAITREANTMYRESLD